MIADIEVVETGFDLVFNNYIINELLNTGHWNISVDYKTDFTDIDSYKITDTLPDTYCDSGMLLTSFKAGRPNSLNEQGYKFNIIAELILNTVLTKQKKYNLSNIRIVRVLWNYYNRSSSGVLHIDNANKNHGSVIYYLNTCDAHTIIEDKSIPCIMGTAVIFNANKIHKGTGPVRDKQKYCMNIVFEYD
jgi:hypothetical protein